MPRLRLPFSRRSAASPAPESQSKEPGTPVESSATTPQSAATPQAAAAARQASPAASAASQPGGVTQERVDGLRAWVAQVDRKLGVRTYVGAAIALLALAAAVVSLVLTLSLKQDAATDNDIQSLRDQISGVEQSASSAAEDSVQALDQRLTELADDVNRISTGQTTARRELKVVQDDIKELRAEASGGQSSGSSGSPGSQP